MLAGNSWRANRLRPACPQESNQQQEEPLTGQNEPENSGGVSPKPTLFPMITGFCISQGIYVAAKLGIANLLKGGPKSSDEMTESVGASPRALYRLLRFLASVGIFSEDQDGRFELTPLSEGLPTGVPGSLRAMAIMYCKRRPLTSPISQPARSCPSLATQTRMWSTRRRTFKRSRVCGDKARPYTLKAQATWFTMTAMRRSSPRSECSCLNQ